MSAKPELFTNNKEQDDITILNSRVGSRAFNLSRKMNIVVKGKDESYRPWSETATISSLSSSGAGFSIPRKCSVGRLVSLILSMPGHLRRYDMDKRLYRVWGLVQYCYEAGGDDSGFHVGVALIGRDAPESYLRDPVQSYRIAGTDKNGLWKIEELESSFKSRGS